MMYCIYVLIDCAQIYLRNPYQPLSALPKLNIDHALGGPRRIALQSPQCTSCPIMAVAETTKSIDICATWEMLIIKEKGYSNSSEGNGACWPGIEYWYMLSISPYIGP